MTTETAKSRPSSGPRRLLFRLAAGLLILVSIEIGSFALLSLSEGGTVSLVELELRRRARSNSPRDRDVDRPSVEQLKALGVDRNKALHPYLGWVVDPDSLVAARNPKWNRQAADYGFPLNTRDPFETPASGEVVIGVFGGSFALSMAANKSILERPFRRLPRFAGGRISVMDFALGGYKQPQQLMALNYLLAVGIHLDIVVNIDGFNEIALPPTTNIPQSYFPFYPRGWELMVGHLDQKRRQRIGEVAILRRRREEWADVFSRNPWRYSMTAGALWTVLDAHLTRRISEAELVLSTAKQDANESYQAHGPRRLYSSDEAMYEDLVRVWKQASIQMHHLCRGLGIEYYHFLQPNQYLPGTKPMGAEELALAWTADHPFRKLVEETYPLLIAAGDELRQSGVAFYDLTRVFSGIEEPLYKDDCCHVNLKGSRIVATAIVSAIEEDPSSRDEGSAAE